MDLSVIIVNYNVKHFLEQCLHSVYKSSDNLSVEIIVVDNNSVDGSCQMVHEKFPDVIQIENKKNLGFSTANNQGIKIAKGNYVLLLNPDTIVQEDTLFRCFEFMENNPLAGSLGVKMIDGKGNFLPESKRSLPTPAVSFFKIFGLSALFPKSKIFGRYHLGYLDKEQVHSVEVLPGAFMFIRKKVLEEIGLLDETFFMYGEDIDLSYRIILGGYKNYYFPRTAIIHYKGESTKKGSINYVMVFYRAMIIFARKHFSRKNAWLFSLLINLAIYLRASVSILRRLFLNFITPLFDAALIYSGFLLLQPLWAHYKFRMEDYYPVEYLLYVVPVYVLIWILFVYLAGGYEKKIYISDLLRGIVFGSVGILLIYALLPESLRYSRALLLFGALWAIFSFFLTRLIIGSIFKVTRLHFRKQKKRIAIAGSPDESHRVMDILKQVDIHPVLIGLVNYRGNWQGDQYIGNLDQLKDISSINRIDEIVFCARDIPSQDIISTMLAIGDTPVEFKIAPPESLSVIGSSSINTAGELYVLHLNALSSSIVRRKKKLFDILISLLILGISPFLLALQKNPLGFIRNIFRVLFGVKSWIGLAETGQEEDKILPDIVPGILTPVPAGKEKPLSGETIKRMNLLYAKDYKIRNDLSILLRDIKFLGN
ncbi:MAG: glycosyltransferase [Bacteroidales bacterium]|nr:glycosyltransferase [Bacteroidales bacterium]